MLPFRVARQNNFENSTTHNLGQVNQTRKKASGHKTRNKIVHFES